MLRETLLHELGLILREEFGVQLNIQQLKKVQSDLTAFYSQLDAIQKRLNENIKC